LRRSGRKYPAVAASFYFAPETFSARAVERGRLEQIRDRLALGNS